jgi:hypothetical protein
MDIGAATALPAQNKLHVSRFRLAENVRNIWSVSPAEDVAFETLLHPEYWTHVARQLRAGDRIEIEPEDGSYFAQLRVLSVGERWASVQVLSKVDTAHAVEAPADGDGYFYKWRGPHAGHSILRTSDKHVMKEGFASKDEAMRYLIELSKRAA